MMDQQPDTGKEFTGRKALLIICSCFAVIIGVNLTLAFQAVSTFPGLEKSKKYIAGQGFEERRVAQEALGWDVAAVEENGILRLSFTKDDMPVAPEITEATLGRATTVADDMTPKFEWTGRAFTADTALGPGNWNLRLEARAADGTRFRQRIIVKVIR